MTEPTVDPNPDPEPTPGSGEMPEQEAVTDTGGAPTPPADGGDAEQAGETGKGRDWQLITLALILWGIAIVAVAINAPRAILQYRLGELYERPTEAEALHAVLELEPDLTDLEREWSRTTSAPQAQLGLILLFGELEPDARILAMLRQVIMDASGEHSELTLAALQVIGKHYLHDEKCSELLFHAMYRNIDPAVQQEAAKLLGQRHPGEDFGFAPADEDPLRYIWAVSGWNAVLYQHDEGKSAADLRQILEQDWRSASIDFRNRLVLLHFALRVAEPGELVGYLADVLLRFRDELPRELVSRALQEGWWPQVPAAAGVGLLALDRTRGSLATWLPEVELASPATPGE